MKNIKITMRNTLYLLLAVVVIAGCSEPVKEKEITGKYSIILDDGGWGGKAITDEYILKDGYYIFVSKADGDSIKLKEGAVWCVKKHNNR